MANGPDVLKVPGTIRERDKCHNVPKLAEIRSTIRGGFDRAYTIDWVLGGPIAHRLVSFTAGVSERWRGQLMVNSGLG